MEKGEGLGWKWEGFGETKGEAWGRKVWQKKGGLWGSFWAFLSRLAPLHSPMHPEVKG